MKPPRFEYADPTSVSETMALLAEHGAEGKILAGGQSFVPLLNFRMAQPQMLIDINRVSELDGITVNGDGLVIGALTRQQHLLENETVLERWPLLAEAARFIGHRTIRNRGTVGGSLAHADPSAELPAAAVVLDARLTVQGQSGERTVPAREFFVDYLMTVVEPEELLTSVTFPELPERTGWSFQEISRRHGDFAMVAVAALVTLDGDGNCSDARLALTGVGAVPYAADVASGLRGQEVNDDRINEVVRASLAGLQPVSDHHASADYRRTVAETLSRRALATATERARERGVA